MKITSWLKRVGVRQILTAFLAGIFLFVGTACSALQAKTASEIRDDLPKSAIDSPAEGGINVYPDTDPRKNTSRTSTKAKALIDNAERQVIDESGNVVDNTKRILDKKGENLRDFGDNAREDAAKLPQQTRSVTRDLSNKAQSNVDEAVEAGKSVGRKTQRAAENTSQNLKSGINRASNSTKRALDNAADTID